MMVGEKLRTTTTKKTKKRKIENTGEKNFTLVMNECLDT